MIDLSYLKTTTENDPALMNSLIKLFIEQLPELKSKLITAYENMNWKALKEAAHKAKSSFQIVGDYKQADELHQIEIMSVENRPKSDFDQLVSNFKNTCASIVVELEEVIR